MQVLKAEEGKVFAYKNKQGKEIILGNIIYLGKDADASKFYQIDIPAEPIVEESNEEDNE